VNDRYIKHDTGEVFDHYELDPDRSNGIQNNTTTTKAVTVFAQPGERVRVYKPTKRPDKTKSAFTMVYDDDLRLLLPSLSPNEALVLMWLTAHIDFDGTTKYEGKRLTVGKLIQLLPWSKAEVARDAIESLEAKEVITRVYQNSRVIYLDVNPAYFYKGGNADAKRRQAIEEFYRKVEAARKFREKVA
jgi:hypothetical protein